jgi:hypothetical protein
MPERSGQIPTAMQAEWAGLGNPTLDPPTVALLIEQAEHLGGSIPALAARGDRGQIAVTKTLDEL